MVESLPLISPDMAGPQELEWWANKIEAHHKLPELVLRLLKASNATGIGVPIDEAVNASGWDGTADSKGTYYLPEGELCFEMGAGKTPKNKADSDFEARLANTRDLKSKHFIFVTPRPWTKKSKWEEEKTRLGKFKSVRVFDGPALVQWMSDYPEVHLWFSELLGLDPKQAKLLNYWWQDFSSRLKHPVPLEFFTRDRASESEELVRFCESSNSRDKVLSIESKSVDDSLAFICGTFKDSLDNSQLVVVVNSDEALRRLSRSESKFIFVVPSDVVDANPALIKNHKVIFLIDASSDLHSGDRIRLSPITLGTADMFLRSMAVDGQLIAKLIPLARRNMATFLRTISINPTFQKPNWLLDANSKQVTSMLGLIGAWEDSDADIVAEIVGFDPLVLEDLLTQLTSAAEPPFVRAQTGWRATSLEQLVDLTTNLLSIKRVKLVLASILRVFETGGASKVFIRSVCKSVILRMIIAESSTQNADHLELLHDFVARVIPIAMQNENSLSYTLPYIAEAEPEIFLKVIEAEVSSKSTNLNSFFPDEQRQTNDYVDLLWALETLACNESYFLRASRIFTKLNSLSKPVRSGNSPIASLKNLCLPQWQIGGVDYNLKLSFLNSLIIESPETAKSLLLELWPSNHKTLLHPRFPIFREWNTEIKQTPLRDWLSFEDALIELAIELSEKDQQYWPKVIERLPDLDLVNVEKIFTSLRDSTGEISKSPDLRFEVWSSIQTLISRNQESAGAAWVMPISTTNALAVIADALGLNDDPRRFGHLFNWNYEFAQSRGDAKSMTDAVHQEQIVAVESLLENGESDLEKLAVNCERPDKLGTTIAISGKMDVLKMADWLQSQDQALQWAAGSYFSTLYAVNGWIWFKELIGSNDFPLKAKESLVRSLRLTEENFSLLMDFPEKLNAEYWRHANGYADSGKFNNEAINNFLKHGNPAAALVMAANDSSNEPLSDELLSSIVSSYIELPNEKKITNSLDSYHLAKVLHRLETNGYDPDTVASYEFVLFHELHDHEPNKSLFRSIVSSPNRFVDFVGLIFGAEADSWFTALAGAERARQIALSVSFAWSGNVLENSEGLVEFESLHSWVVEVRGLLEHEGLLRQGDGQLGEILAKAAPSSDSSWPHESVAKLIEEIKSDDLDRGVIRGKINSRGVTTRGIYDGGMQEKDIAAGYREAAKGFDAAFPRCASVLRVLQARFEHEAQFFDNDAERFGDSE